MHEMSLVVALFDQVLDLAQKNQMTKIDEVEIDVGYLKQIVPEIMYQAFNAVTKGTLAEGAILKFNEIAPQAECRFCHRIFIPQIDDFLCPDCQTADIIIHKGDEFILKSIAGSRLDNDLNNK